MYSVFLLVPALFLCSAASRRRAAFRGGCRSARLALWVAGGEGASAVRGSALAAARAFHARARARACALAIDAALCARRLKALYESWRVRAEPLHASCARGAGRS